MNMDMERDIILSYVNCNNVYALFRKKKKHLSR